jgi:Na+/H+ antiporter NhaD/arsenite permease-like protein
MLKLFASRRIAELRCRMDTHAKWMLSVFIIGYFFITIEHLIKIDKATVALLTGIICWVIQYTHAVPACGDSLTCLGEHVSNISQIIFFLLGALGIVEIINAHKGFSIISNMLHIQSKRKFFWTIASITFILSSVLDNLTTTIVMITIVRKLVEDSYERLLIGSGIVIAANAGGAWSPIGDVTTTMLWIEGQITTIAIMRDLLLPSVLSLVVSIFLLSLQLKGTFPLQTTFENEKQLEPAGKLIFFLGIGLLLFVPVFKILTGLPPFMGVLFGLSLLWLVTDLIHGKYRDRIYLRVPSIFAKINLSTLLFFLGILLAIDAMESAQILHLAARWFDENIGNVPLIATLIGLASAIIDNVPLVAATMGMYSLEQYPPDHMLWQLIAFCAGTGGSILIIGSAAGVVFMGLEKVDFLWYLKRISLPALLGYFAGIASYLLLI